MSLSLISGLVVPLAVASAPWGEITPRTARMSASAVVDADRGAIFDRRFATRDPSEMSRVWREVDGSASRPRECASPARRREH